MCPLKWLKSPIHLFNVIAKKNVHNKDIFANQNERRENFLQFAFNPNFLAPFLWILWRFEVKQKKNKFFFCNIFEILHA